MSLINVRVCSVPSTGIHWPSPEQTLYHQGDALAVTQSDIDRTTSHDAYGNVTDRLFALQSEIDAGIVVAFTDAGGNSSYGAPIVREQRERETARRKGL